MARQSDLEKNIHPITINQDRPSPPHTLDKAEAVIWDRLFMTLENEWIRPQTYEVAIAYCRHVASANRTSKLIHEHEKRMFESGDLLDVDNLKILDRLMKMADRENRAVTSLATKLRITNQSLRTSHAANPVAKQTPFGIDDYELIEEAERGEINLEERITDESAQNEDDSGAEGDSLD